MHEELHYYSIYDIWMKLPHDLKRAGHEEEEIQEYNLQTTYLKQLNNNEHQPIFQEHDKIYTIKKTRQLKKTEFEYDYLLYNHFLLYQHNVKDQNQINEDVYLNQLNSSLV